MAEPPMAETAELDEPSLKELLAEARRIKTFDDIETKAEPGSPLHAVALICLALDEVLPRHWRKAPRRERLIFETALSYFFMAPKDGRPSVRLLTAVHAIAEKNRLTLYDFLRFTLAELYRVKRRTPHRFARALELARRRLRAIGLVRG